MALYNPFKRQPEGEATSPETASPKSTEAGGGFFSGLKEALVRTNTVLNTDIRDLFKKQGELVNEEFLERLLATLVRTDMGIAAAKRICARIGSDFRARVVTDEVVASIKDELVTMMEQGEVTLRMADSGPTVIMVVGVNGSGKTTSIAKLAHHFKQQGKSVILGAGDTFRAAAVEQLTIWSQRLDVGIVKAEQGSNPGSVAYRAVEAALAQSADVCIIDTAGRLQTQQNLMKELGKIKASISKQLPEAPHEVLLVLDATTGQNGLSQAQKFSEVVDCTGLVLAKLDGTAKGGVAVAIRQRFDLPIKFVGIGEGAADMVPFEAHAFADALFAR